MVFSSPWGTRVHPPNIDWQLLGCEGQCQRLRFSGGQNRHGPHPPAALESPGGLVRGPWTASQSFTQRSREGLRTGVFKFPDDADPHVATDGGSEPEELVCCPRSDLFPRINSRNIPFRECISPPSPSLLSSFILWMYHDNLPLSLL